MYFRVCRGPSNSTWFMVQRRLANAQIWGRGVQRIKILEGGVVSQGVYLITLAYLPYMNAKLNMAS